jgi:hypothetical protein
MNKFFSSVTLMVFLIVNVLGSYAGTPAPQKPPDFSTDYGYHSGINHREVAKACADFQFAVYKFFVANSISPILVEQFIKDLNYNPDNAVTFLTQHKFSDESINEFLAAQQAYESKIRLNSNTLQELLDRHQIPTANFLEFLSRDNLNSASLYEFLEHYGVTSASVQQYRENKVAPAASAVSFLDQQRKQILELGMRDASLLHKTMVATCILDGLPAYYESSPDGNVMCFGLDEKGMSTQTKILIGAGIVVAIVVIGVIIWFTFGAGAPAAVAVVDTAGAAVEAGGVAGGGTGLGTAVTGAVEVSANLLAAVAPSLGPNVGSVVLSAATTIAANACTAGAAAEQIAAAAEPVMLTIGAAAAMVSAEGVATATATEVQGKLRSPQQADDAMSRQRAIFEAGMLDAREILNSDAEMYEFLHNALLFLMMRGNARPEIDHLVANNIIRQDVADRLFGISNIYEVFASTVFSDNHIADLFALARPYFLVIWRILLQQSICDRPTGTLEHHMINVHMHLTQYLIAFFQTLLFGFAPPPNTPVTFNQGFLAMILTDILGPEWHSTSINLPPQPAPHEDE